MASTKARCPRSLVEILISAASTAAFIAAANFGFAPIISSKAGTWARWFQCLKMALGEPFRAFAHSLVSAAISWHTLRSTNINYPEPARPAAAANTGTGGRRLIQKIRQEIERIGLVGIMLNCPILIQIPTDSGFTEVGYSGDSKKKKVKISEPSWVQNAQVVTALTREDIHPWNPLELPAQPGDQRDIVEGRVRSDQSCSGPPYYIKLHPSQYWRSRGMIGIEERTLLLKLKLVPEYAQLRYLRARSTFEAVVTTVQSVGYMLGVGQRIVMKRAVSPLEAIMAFFNLLIVLQFIMNLYSCVHYQRPLLLRLSPEQFMSWYLAKASASSSSASTTTTYSAKVVAPVFLGLVSVAIYTIIQFSFIHYALSYLHRCILCSLSAFLVCLLALSALILIALFSIRRFRKIWKSPNKRPQYALRVCTSVISTSSTLLALVATIISWDKFREPTGNLLQWIVPYVSS